MVHTLKKKKPLQRVSNFNMILLTPYLKIKSYFVHIIRI